MWANWMVKLLDGKGNIVFLGGPAGNPVTSGQLKSIVKVFAKHPGMKLLTGKKTWPVTNWDPATAQKQMSALLAKYKKIDGIISDYGTDALAATRAMQAANRKLVPIGTLDANGLSCLYKKVHKSNPQFQLATISSRNWLGRVAARKAIAAAQGLPNKEPSTYELPFFENSVSGQDPVCVPSRRARLLLVEQADAGDDQQVREAVVGRCRKPASFSASPTSSRRSPGSWRSRASASRSSKARSMHS